ncbi:MAG: hypothetical protein B7Z02_07850 [Rhodobacterales bacterium 32-67-9]|nr:MAG: hypothetical protein B7Z02_07850 [Rhodobacterales bacterium 32-67-9]
MRHALTAAALLMPTLALAHAGDHGAPGIGSLITHALSEPDHALTLAVVVGVPCAIWAVSRRRG